MFMLHQLKYSCKRTCKTQENGNTHYVSLISDQSDKKVPHTFPQNFTIHVSSTLLLQRGAGSRLVPTLARAVLTNLRYCLATQDLGYTYV